MRKTYYKHKIENLLVVNKIVTIHHFNLDKDFKSEGESHDFWELVYAEKNGVVCQSENDIITLKQGEIFFHKPDEYHVLMSDGVNAPTVFIISFVCKSEAMGFFEKKKLKLNEYFIRTIHRILDEGKRTFNLEKNSPSTKKLILSDTPSLGGQQMIKNQLEEMLIELLRESAEGNNSESVFLSEQDYARRTVTLIEKFLKENVDKKITVDDIAKELSYNKSYLFRKFKEETGTTIISRFNYLKIKEAENLLISSPLNITEISDKLSFDSPNYFIKLFKKITGLTPKEYRKTYSK